MITNLLGCLLLLGWRESVESSETVEATFPKMDGTVFPLNPLKPIPSQPVFFFSDLKWFTELTQYTLFQCWESGGGVPLSIGVSLQPTRLAPRATPFNLRVNVLKWQTIVFGLIFGIF